MLLSCHGVLLSYCLLGWCVTKLLSVVLVCCCYDVIPGLKLALVQLAVGADKSANVSRACDFISQAAKAGAQLVALPVCVSGV